jgi:prevent-host-death family protein
MQPLVGMMLHVSYPLTQASPGLGELVSRARHDHERVFLTEHGQPVAAIVSIEDLAELERTQDAADLAECQAIKSRSVSGVPHDEFMAMLEAEDAARA